MRIVILIFVSVLLVSCGFSNEEEVEKENEEFVFDLYEPSEMSLLMNTMFEHNEKIKQEIIAGKIPDTFPEEFMKIHTAKLSDNKYRNETFEAYSKVLIENEEAIFDTTLQTPIVQRYNNVINTCISCHTTECTGPIPRIKKLLID